VALNLIVEIDGEQHQTEEGQERDERRDRYLAERGYTLVGSAVAVDPRPDERGLSWILPWLAFGWSLGVITFSLRPFLALYRCHQLLKQACPLEVPWTTDTVESFCERIGLNRDAYAGKVHGSADHQMAGEYEMQPRSGDL
jgi:hypothetical protein